MPTTPQVWSREHEESLLKGIIIISFQRHGKVTASRLPPKFLRNYRKDCPICVAKKKRTKSLPKGPNSAHELDHLVPWEEVFTDSSGKFRRKSKQGNNYFAVFVCAKTGEKIAIPHVKYKHFPLVYFKFTKRGQTLVVQKLTESKFGILKFGIPIEIWSLMSAGIGCMMIFFPLWCATHFTVQPPSVPIYTNDRH